jgi:hypothetical protein
MDFDGGSVDEVGSIAGLWGYENDSGVLESVRGIQVSMQMMEGNLWPLSKIVIYWC